MTSFIRTSAIQRKAVWGNKHLVAAFTLVIGCATHAFAGDPHAGVATVRPGSPNAAAINRHGKLDNELAYRATYRPASALTRVIVTLKPGAALPAEYKKYAKRGLGII